MERIDCAVIGAGVVGLAVARAMALAGREVVILERETTIGTGASSRNSEVIHAGIYYPRGSLKARLCVNGRHALYAYCAARGIAHQQCGKLIVATDDSQIERLRALAARGLANGVDNLQWLTGSAVQALEPALRCIAALFSPSTGILDSHALMLSLLGDAEAAGAVLALSSPVESVTFSNERIVLNVGGAEPSQFMVQTVINSAGLWAPALARTFRGLDHSHLPRGYFAKGSYFTLAGPAPFARLIYPLPETDVLGIHFTFDLVGQSRFGPDVEWVDCLDYSVRMERSIRFYAAVRRYWPDLPDGALRPGYAGIRPKIHGPGEPVPDFIVAGETAAHTYHRLINLFGIESPGLTSCLALADMVVDATQRH
ncbi:Aminobutyraldehyde dehydrogenase [invertebrate metagenome]|uniref:Aminobutyraldehyde dehydrogenase n=1 Tax=invertebrate metagenome TaxID=1711999 RepID=A0A484H7L9_9ZZZZ